MDPQKVKITGNWKLKSTLSFLTLEYPDHGSLNDFLRIRELVFQS
jgi:hypothetical protein